MVAVGQHPEHGLVAVLAGADLVRPCRGRSGRPGRPACPRSTITSPASNSRCTKRSASAVEHLDVVEAAQQRQLAQLLRDDPDLGAGAGEGHPAVADGVAQPAVDAVRAAGDLDPGQQLAAASAR